MLGAHLPIKVSINIYISTLYICIVLTVDTTAYNHLNKIKTGKKYQGNQHIDKGFRYKTFYSMLNKKGKRTSE